MTSESFFSFQKHNSVPQNIGSQNDEWRSGKNEGKSQNLNKQTAAAVFWQLNQKKNQCISALMMRFNFFC